MKVLVETQGSFMLVDPYTGEVIDSDGCSVVTSSQFIQARVSVGQVRVHLGELSNEATTEEWREFLKASDGNTKLALASFESKFGPSHEPESIGPSFEDIRDVVATLDADAFQKDGKPKVGALKTLFPEMNTELRDAYWEWANK